MESKLNHIKKRDQQYGVALPVILMLLIVITMMGVSTVKTGNFQAVMANNSRAIQIVDQLAETAVDTVIESVIDNDECFSINDMRKKLVQEEVKEGKIITTADEGVETAGAAIDLAGGVNLGFGGGAACIGDDTDPEGWEDVAGRGVLGRTDSRFCGPVSGVVGFEMGSFVNMKYETRGLAKMVNTNTAIQNVRLWVQMGVDANEMQPVIKDCT